MSQQGETFFTSIGCMDGRSECTVAKWGRKKFDVKFADTITEAGLVGLLSKSNTDRYLLESLKKKIFISIEKHHSKQVVVSGHQDCAGNPVEDEKHRQDTLKAAAIIKSFVPTNIEIIPVFVKRDLKQGWMVEKL